MKLLLLPLLAASSLAAEPLTLAELDTEIRKREVAITEVLDVMRKAFVCGNDVTDLVAGLKHAQQNLRAARSRKDKEAVAKGEAELKELQKHKTELERPRVPGVTPESIAEQINQLKKEKLELEVQRDALIKSQAKPK